MKLVLDANISFSLMKPDSIASYLFSTLGAKFFAPEHIESELDKHNPECLAKSKLSEHEFEIRQKEVKGNIEFIGFSKYEGFIKESKRVLSDEEDSPYLALALSINAPIWSNDPHLKQQPLVKVYTTKELVYRLLNP